MPNRINVSSVPTQLRALKKRTRMSLRKIAQDAGYADASSIQRYFDLHYDRPYLDREVANKLCDALVGEGDPPIRKDEILILAGIDSFAALPFDDDGAMAHVRELDIRAAAGGGAVNEPDQTRVGKWGFPAAWLRHEARAEPEHLAIITIEGDSMEPLLYSGDKAIVDRSKTAPSPPGIFAIHDGFGLVAKKVEAVPNSDPVMVKLTSANPSYSAYERTLDEVHIAGRIVGVWRRV